VLSARYRMTRSAEFGATVNRGVRVVQPNLVIHARRDPDCSDGPRIGFVVSRSVGNAVQRHRVSRRLRHAAQALVGELSAADRVVIRALPSSRDAESARLRQEIAAGIRRTRRPTGAAQ